MGLPASSCRMDGPTYCMVMSTAPVATASVASDVLCHAMYLTSLYPSLQQLLSHILRRSADAGDARESYPGGFGRRLGSGGMRPDGHKSQAAQAHDAREERSPGNHGLLLLGTACPLPAISPS